MILPTTLGDVSVVDEPAYTFCSRDSVRFQSNRRRILQFLPGFIGGLGMKSHAQEISDPWYTPAKSALEPTSTLLAWHVDFEEAERSQIELVEHQLAGSAIIKITEPVAVALASRELRSKSGHTFFLARSLRFDAHGSYTVQRDNKSLRIHHSSLGFDAPIVHQGLILLLPEKPMTVYCTCSMAR